ncbi:MAG TPA: DUF3089 domain-containing protein [Jatrophihabitantaceae bacterium]|nr:DUF3089 domain-containing protein [Jatrophihabitantaceae bacterium]
MPRRDHAGTSWLCRPGLAHNPCTSTTEATVVPASGNQRREQLAPAAHPSIDCFYVYPTVSKQQRINANRHVQPAETHAAIAQAARFSHVCRVFAPMYPQLTLSAIATGGNSATIAGAIKAYEGVFAAWRDYLRNFNHGRGVVLIGHSQGAFLLTALLQREVDREPAVRKRLVSAILPGANVTVPRGKRVGGAFQRIPSCQSDNQIGCVIAYSTFDTIPSADALFGRAGTSIGRQLGLGGPSKRGMQVLCTNPAALDRGSHALRSYFPREMGQTPSSVSTRWVTYPGEYRASCEHQSGASWLQINRDATDWRPAVYASLGQTWGLHVYDINLALGNLVDIVGKQARAYAR